MYTLKKYDSFNLFTNLAPVSVVSNIKVSKKLNNFFPTCCRVLFLRLHASSLGRTPSGTTFAGELQDDASWSCPLNREGPSERPVRRLTSWQPQEPAPANSLVLLMLLALGTFLAGVKCPFFGNLLSGPRHGTFGAGDRVAQTVRTFFALGRRASHRAWHHLLATPGQKLHRVIARDRGNIRLWRVLRTRSTGLLEVRLPPDSDRIADVATGPKSCRYRTNPISIGGG